MKIFYFTATGNSLYVAKQFDAERHAIPQVIKSGRREFEDDIIGLVFPCYGLDAPAPVKTFVETVSLNCRHLFSIITYGNYFADAGTAFVKFAAAHGMTIDYCEKLLMVDNVPILFDIKKQKAKDKKTAENLARILDDVRFERHSVRRANAFDRAVGQIARRYFARHPLGARVKDFSVNETCNGCGTCGKVCPQGNIAMTASNTPEYSSNCIFCLACFHACPQKAITLPGEKAPGERFVNEHVTLAEIVKSNK